MARLAIYFEPFFGAGPKTSVLAGGHSPYGYLCWLKIAGGCSTRQHKPLLPANTNRF
jgi:hypothetical protein